MMDTNTSHFCDVKTLSGSEPFIASLAMALWFLDVVQSRRGGVRLNSMFIDKGFGTFDDETLQLALHVLVGLAGDIQMVSIISHVTQLKENVDKNRCGKTGSGCHIRVEA